MWVPIVFLLVSQCLSHGSFELEGKLDMQMRCAVLGVAPEKIYTVRTAERTIRVYFGSDSRPESGRIRVFGNVVEGKYVVTGWTTKEVLVKRRRSLNLPPSLSVLVVRVEIQDYAAVCTEKEAAEIMWNGESNAKDFWLDMTYRRVAFLNDLDGDGKDDVISVFLSPAPSGCEDIWTLVEAQIKLKYPEIDVTKWNRHVVILPANYKACGFATATIGCREGDDCKAYITACTDYPDSIIHELGHTLGLRHGAGYSMKDGATVDDYEDRGTTMGYSYPDRPRRGLNAVHRATIGMRNGNIVTLQPGFSGPMSIYGLHFADTDADTKVKVLLLTVARVQYYLSYRVSYANTYEADLSRDLGGRLGPWSSTVQVHSEIEEGHSFAHATLSLGQLYDFNGSGVNATFVSISDNIATISISAGPYCGNGIVDGGEACDGGACCSAECTFMLASTVCRPKVGICDTDEMCTGSGAACPENGFAAQGTPCRNATTDCDSPDFCDGAGRCPNSKTPDGKSCNLSGCPVPTPGQCISNRCIGECAVIVTTTSSSANPSTTLSNPPSSSTPSAATSPGCGDGFCNGDENCRSCPADCSKGTQNSRFFCCSSWGCSGRGCPTLSQVISFCKLSISQACLPSGSMCHSSDACCGGSQCFFGQCK